MNTLVIGGTGFIGDQAVRMLLEQGHRVKALALPELPVDYEQPEGLELIQNDISGLSEDALAAILVGCDSLVYAAGIDERVDGTEAGKMASVCAKSGRAGTCLSGRK